MYKISDKGLEFTAHSEGFEPEVYMDAGHPAIAYGHDLLPGESFPGGVTQEEGDSILREDMDKAEEAVNGCVKVPLTQGQFDALCDFQFNTGALEKSTLLKLLNEGKYAAACGQFYWEDGQCKPHGWIFSKNPKTGNTEPNPGLIARRKGEQELFNS